MYEALKMRLAQIVEANRQVKGNPSVPFIHLVKALYADESLTNDRLVQLCGLDRKTFYRNNADIKAVQSMLPPWCPQGGDFDTQGGVTTVGTKGTTVGTGSAHGGNTTAKEEKEKIPPHPFIKEREEKSFPQTPNGGCPPGPQGGSAQESLHDVLNNIKQDFYKSHGIVTRAEDYTSVGADATQVDNSPKRELANPQEFQKFFDDYPKRKGMQGGVAYEKVRHLWMQLEESGWGYEINTALKAALCSKRWSENNGQFIPTVFNFLENEEFRQFLPTGYKPKKPQPKREQKPLEGGIYDLL